MKVRNASHRSFEQRLIANAFCSQAVVQFHVQKKKPHYPYGLPNITLCGDRRIATPTQESPNAVGECRVSRGRRTPPSPANNRLPSITQWRQHMEFNKEFDATGMACPLPIVKTKKALADMASGQVLRVIATDPGSVCDMAAFAEQTGNVLLEQGTEGGKHVFYLKKA